MMEYVWDFFSTKTLSDNNFSSNFCVASKQKIPKFLSLGGSSHFSKWLITMVIASPQDLGFSWANALVCASNQLTNCLCGSWTWDAVGYLAYVTFGGGEILPHPPPKKDKIDIIDIDIQIYTGPRTWNQLWETSSSKLRTDRNGEKKAEYEYTAVHIPVRTLKHRYLQYICTIPKLVALQANVKSWPYEYPHATLKWFGWSSWDCCRRLRSLVIHWVCLGFRSQSSWKGR